MAFLSPFFSKKTNEVTRQYLVYVEDATVHM